MSRLYEVSTYVDTTKTCVMYLTLYYIPLKSETIVQLINDWPIIPGKSGSKCKIDSGGYGGLPKAAKKIKTKSLKSFIL